VGKLRNKAVWLMRYIIYYKRSKKIAEDVAMKASHKPLIVSDEDFASIAVSQNVFPLKNVLIYDILESSKCNTSYDKINVERSIADTHFTTGPLHIFEKMMNRSLRNLVNKCDKVIIPDFGSNRTNLSYVGPIVREVTSHRNKLRDEFGLT